MITITIETKNAVFGQGEATEVCRILREVAEKLEFAHELQDLPVFDLNGNRVGEVKVA